MKKIIALFLATLMAFTLCSCGAPAKTSDSKQETNSADEIPDNMESADGKYSVAFIADIGLLKDKSFNQGTYDGVKLYAAENGLSYKYYQPANGDKATDDDRYDAMKAAVDGGAEVVVCVGFMQGNAIEKAAKELKDTKFVFIDGWDMGLDNIASISFKEEQCGYFAGYAVVKEGFTKLGFSGGGGGTNEACERYGYGFVQGANAAAAEMGVNVEMNYSWEYGSAFSASPELQTMINGWYENGTEVVFACGGSMFASITAAAAENDGFVIGVDTDQSSESDTVITSATKGLADAAIWACTKCFDGTWNEISGTAVSLGAAEGSTGIPTDTWRMNNYTVEEYKAQFASVVDGSLIIDDDFAKVEQDYSNLTLRII